MPKQFCQCLGITVKLKAEQLHYICCLINTYLTTHSRYAIVLST